MVKQNEVDKIYRQANYIVTRLLYENDLSESQIEFLNEFIKNYYELLDNHIAGKDEPDTLEILQIYEMVLNDVDANYEELKDLPASKIIYKHIDKHNQEIEKKFDEFSKEKEARIRELKKVADSNGFSEIALIISSTIILGIALGALLWIIK